ncbi:kidney mitochondrial carrier protein 1-like [Dendronephthya gigantea]|uniref:kidney mitochondrial carrier protein 1-like n=1 Tax=Dendronephthya gigantea TaxID=151771 RepID=UPI00106C010C|nr:kidney mitochondrial carrier protein 1-like [Dendronephthya gigantea]
MDWRPFLYGGLASMTAEAATFPIDTTKTRLQLQGQHIDVTNKEIRYKGMFSAFVRISKEEGARALYNGVAPALLRQATYGTIKIGMYHGIKRIIVKDPKDEKFYYNIISGIVAGAVAAALCTPTDLLKVRMQAQSQGVAPAKGMFSSFAAIFREEGFSGLYRGVVPNAQRAAVVAGVELAVYDWCKKKILDNELMEDNVYTHFLSSFTAGFAGAVASNPIDVVKTRLMNQRKLKHNEGGAKIYRNSLDCILTTIRTERFFALYRGFIPNFVRLCPWNIVFFMSFEQYKKFGDNVL